MLFWPVIMRFVGAGSSYYRLKTIFPGTDYGQEPGAGIATGGDQPDIIVGKAGAAVIAIPGNLKIISFHDPAPTAAGRGASIKLTKQVA